MPTNTTFSSLTTDMQNYLERGGSTVTDQTVYEQIPRLINLAERKLADRLKLLGQIEVFTSVPPSGGLQASNPSIAKPDRWRATASMGFGTGTGQNTFTPLNLRGYETLLAYWPTSTDTGVPEFYADVNLENWWIAPTPDQAYPLRAVCWMLPPLLSDENQSNFWAAYCPEALLFMSLLEATPFLLNDPRIPVWQQKANEALAVFAGQDVQRMFDRASRKDSP